VRPLTLILLEVSRGPACVPVPRQQTNRRCNVNFLEPGGRERTDARRLHVQHSVNRVPHLYRETEPDWPDEIAGDVKAECGKYGAVLHLHVDKDSKVRRAGLRPPVGSDPEAVFV